MRHPFKMNIPYATVYGIRLGHWRFLVLFYRTEEESTFTLGILPTGNRS